MCTIHLDDCVEYCSLGFALSRKRSTKITMRKINASNLNRSTTTPKKTTSTKTATFEPFCFCSLSLSPSRSFYHTLSLFHRDCSSDYYYSKHFLMARIFYSLRYSSLSDITINIKQFKILLDTHQTYVPEPTLAQRQSHGDMVKKWKESRTKAFTASLHS